MKNFISGNSMAFIISGKSMGKSRGRRRKIFNYLYTSVCLRWPLKKNREHGKVTTASKPKLVYLVHVMIMISSFVILTRSKLPSIFKKDLLKTADDYMKVIEKLTSRPCLFESEGHVLLVWKLLIQTPLIPFDDI
jgi:hypothetical protein